MFVKCIVHNSYTDWQNVQKFNRVRKGEKRENPQLRLIILIFRLFSVMFNKRLSLDKIKIV